MTESTRPKRVVVVDADDPLREIQGEFYWHEDHARIVASEREAAYRDGYAAGIKARPTKIRITRRRGVLRRLITWLIVIGLVIAYAIEIIGGMLR
jgi:hypothetical protein